MEVENKDCTLPSGPDLHLLIIGKTGSGKSSTGNAVLGVQLFATSWDAHSEAVNCALRSNRIGERTIKVLDTPGLCDTRMDVVESRQQTLDALGEAIDLCPEGLDAILIVLSFGVKMTPENVGVIDDLRQMLGEDILREYGVIVFTGGDSFALQSKSKNNATFAQWCEEQQRAMNEILEECQNRCVVFNNVTEDEAIVNRQRFELIQLVDELASSGRRYTSQDFDVAKEGWLRAKEECKKSEVAREVWSEIGQVYGEITKEIGKAQAHGKDVALCDKLRNRLDGITSLRMNQLDTATQETMLESIHRLKDEMTITREKPEEGIPDKSKEITPEGPEETIPDNSEQTTPEESENVSPNNGILDLLTSVVGTVLEGIVIPRVVEELRLQLPGVATIVTRLLVRFLGTRKGKDKGDPSRKLSTNV